MKWIFLSGVVFFFGACHLNRIQSLAPPETYPDDSYLSSVTNKKALIIVAHDDDAIGCSGTISSLCRAGWMVSEFCFYNALPADSLRNIQRRIDLQKVAGIEGLRSVSYAAFNYRNDMFTNDSLYLPFSPTEFNSVYQSDTMYQLISKFISTNDPSVIFTLDDCMGGYGHPDHKMVSMLVNRYCSAHAGDINFHVERIYQSVFTPTQADRVLSSMPVYEQAKKVYQCNGMPAPDVQIDISSMAVQKRKVMDAYSTEQNSIRHIWPYYYKVTPEKYFNIMNREFFRIIDPRLTTHY